MLAAAIAAAFAGTVVLFMLVTLIGWAASRLVTNIQLLWKRKASLFEDKTKFVIWSTLKIGSLVWGPFYIGHRLCVWQNLPSILSAWWFLPLVVSSVGLVFVAIATTMNAYYDRQLE